MSSLLVCHPLSSAASKAGLVSFFDFIVGANEQMLLGSGEGLEEGEEYDDVDFPALLRENVGRPVELREYERAPSSDVCGVYKLN